MLTKRQIHVPAKLICLSVIGLTDLLLAEALDSAKPGLAAGLNLAAAERVIALNLVPIALLLIVISATIAWLARISTMRELSATITEGRLSPIWLAMHFGAVVVLVSPEVGQTFAVVLPGALPGLMTYVGLIATAVLGVMLFLAPAASYRPLARPRLILAGIYLGLLSILLYFAQEWSWSLLWMQNATTESTKAVFWLTGRPAALGSEPNLLILDDFKVIINHACSGISGILLVSAVVIVHLAVSRDRLRLDRGILCVLLGITLSWAMNTVRIVALMIVGADISPELAIDGFHSNAGWIIFILLSLVMIATLERISWFHKARPTPAIGWLPLRQDPAAAMLLPFAIMLAAGLFLNTVLLKPALGNTFLVCSLALSIIFFWPTIASHIAAPKLIPALLGLGIASLWLGFSEPNPHSTLEDLTDLEPATLSGVIWIVFRTAGTGFLVPVAEEMFFRGYLMRRLSLLTKHGVLIGLLASSITFAVFHDTWALAFVAGLIFGALVLRTGKLSDAITCHVVANLAIAAYAIAFDNWSVI